MTMEKFLCAQIYVEQTTINFDKAFNYRVPLDFADKVFIGQRVVVPFGKGNKKRNGIIRNLIFEYESEIEKLKPIVSLTDKTPVLSREMVELAEWLSDRTFCTYMQAVRPMLPAGINVRMVALYSLNENAQIDNNDLTDDERTVINSLKSSKNEVKHERLLEITGLHSNSKLLDEMVKKGYILRSDNAVQKMNDATVRMVKLSDDFDIDNASRLTAKQKAVVEFLMGCQTASAKEVTYFTGISSAVIRTMAKNGVVEYYDNEVYRTPFELTSATDTRKIELTPAQNKAYEGILQKMQSEKPGTSLLYGVTGSGKTQVYLKLIDNVINAGKSVIVMVPEIALTPQTLKIFRNRYGEKVALFHSAMSLGQRMDEFKRVQRGEAKIAIGTRSAVFAPFTDLGLIIMDEEQEHTYKSESTPRFHARDVARFRAGYNKCLLLLASATPSIESYSKAKNGVYDLFTLTERYGTAKLPQVITVDTKEQLASGNAGILSRELTDALTDIMDKGKQAILLLNRRGYNVMVTCKSCSHVASCPNCSISLTYHNANHRMMCHYCGYSEEYTEKCSECGESNIRLSGYGTQKIEEELQTYFPEMRILRMDADTTMARFSHEEKLNAFANGEYDVMVGTQMVAKGLDFPNVTLVGVLNADRSLRSTDFKSSERTFDLLTQVIGRSGRASDDGIALIQTVDPDNPIIELSGRQDYDAFYDMEILTRKMLTYPPYCDLLVCGFLGDSASRAMDAAHHMFSLIKSGVEKNPQLKIVILGPAVCNVPKIDGKYRYRMLIKCRNSKALRDVVRAALTDTEKQYKDVSAFADMNPENII